MNILKFIEKQRPEWEELEELASRTRWGRRLSGEELRRMSRLYRSAATDFAYAETHFEGHDIVVYLNRLIAETHGLIYQRRHLKLRLLLRWIAFDVPGIFITHFRTFLFSFYTFLVFVLIGFLGSELIPGGEKIFLTFSITDPEGAADQAAYYIDRTEDNIKNGRPFAIYEERESRSIMSSRIMVNNVRISIFCFVGGILGGIVTFWVLAMNSMMIGAFFHIFYRHDIILGFWNTTLLHGLIEITMIVMAGMAGFMIGKSLLFPGKYTRGDSLKRAGFHAVQFAIVIALWDVIAAIFEGYVTGARLSEPVKFFINFLSLAALVGYFGVLGSIGYRKMRERERLAKVVASASGRKM